LAISEAVKRWWPLADSLDLVRASIKNAASAVHAEIAGFVAGGPLSTAWVPFGSLDDVFSSVDVFTNVPTIYFVLPTRSDWTVLWNNSFLCDGYDSLCWCITNNHGYDTMHWRSSDEDNVFQAGSLFTYRMRSESSVSERSVYCCKNDDRWHFDVVGDVLTEEDTDAYDARKKKDRLDEAGMLKLLARLGATPWNDDYYEYGEAFRIERVAYPSTILRKAFSDFACKRK
jgi:hypothetical protein